MKKVIKNGTYQILISDSEKYTDEEIKKCVDEVLDKIKVKDVPPMYAPEEELEFTYNKKSGTGGKKPLTRGMIETAFKERHKDDGATFELYLDEIIKSLKDDINNAEYLISGETTDTRKKLLEDYVRIELYAKNAKSPKYAEIRDLINTLSEKLDLNYWRKPKFPEQKRVNVANEFRQQHRWDSQIKHSYKPTFLCTPSELSASYVDAKNGKLPELFEINLRKVQKDINADYNRIKAGYDNYSTDPNIKHTLPEIVNFYKQAVKQARDLGYDNYADDFENKLETITEAWGL